jgi:hypothetical protein
VAGIDDHKAAVGLSLVEKLSVGERDNAVVAAVDDRCRSTANRRACSASEAQIGANAYTLSGHGLVSTPSAPARHRYRRTGSGLRREYGTGCVGHCLWLAAHPPMRAVLRARRASRSSACVPSRPWPTAPVRRAPRRVDPIDVNWPCAARSCCIGSARRSLGGWAAVGPQVALVARARRTRTTRRAMYARSSTPSAIAK